MDSNTVTLITGASSGLGRELAIRLSRVKRLIIHGRDLQRLEETRERCHNAVEHMLWNQELRQIETIASSLEQLIAERELKVEGFVHSVGELKILPLRLMESAVIESMMAVNCFSAAEILRILMRKKVNGAQLRGVVFISSIASQFGARGFSGYCASKGALDAFMRAMAVELAPAVRVNSVLPGTVRTPMTESMFTDTQLRQRMEADYPLGLGEPSDVAAAVEYLLSDNARWVTGQQWVVDGGRTVNITA